MPHLGLLLALLAGPAVAPTSNPGTPVDDEAGDKVLLKTKIKRSGKKEIRHPGQMTETGTEMIFVLKQGEHTHEIGVLLEGGGKRFSADVIYRYDGRKVLQGKKDITKKKWVGIKSGDGKTIVSVFVDPDAGRPDQVDLPDGENPLDGLGDPEP